MYFAATTLEGCQITDGSVAFAEDFNWLIWKQMFSLLDRKLNIKAVPHAESEHSNYKRARCIVLMAIMLPFVVCSPTLCFLCTNAEGFVSRQHWFDGDINWPLEVIVRFIR